MKPASFTYESPNSLAQALALLGEHKGDCKVLAGGQSLVAAMNFRLARPSMLIDINGVNELAYIRPQGEVLAIGALSRHAAFHKPVVEGPTGQLLSTVVKNIAHYPIRQRGTFGGSLSHADPASEWCLVTQTLRAKLTLRSSRGERVVEASDFFRGTFTTALAEDEILTEIRLPLLPVGWTSGFQEFSRRKGDFALAMCLAAIRVENGKVRDARLGAGGISDRPLRLAELETALVGKEANTSVFSDVAEMSRDLPEPSADIHGSSQYRQDLLVTMIRRALEQAAQ